jgi:hypothetical protein
MVRTVLYLQNAYRMQLKKYYCVWKLVNELIWKGHTIYQCELCGFGYRDLETAERCEQYCFSHGRPSPKLTKKSLRKPPVQVDPIAA